ncbi:hypothetical protein [Microcystis aeruginosa]|nr:hypothetical protein [Microcystis aeruginosa]MDB9417139.1 hypothetical protein [Microcystis aeruginosa CS-556/03]
MLTIGLQIGNPDSSKVIGQNLSFCQAFFDGNQWREFRGSI